jgi:DNA-binding transcriptional regulator YhcF (GntR family)
MSAFPFAVKKGVQQPKYKQIITGIIEAIAQKRLRIGDELPSINQVCKKFSLSRDTVVKAYDELKFRGIVEAAHGKGYYIASASVDHKIKVFLLFDELSPYKEILFNSFKNALEEQALIDIYFHHHNVDVFGSLIHDHVGKYGYYVIMPFANKSIEKILNVLPEDRVMLLDRKDIGAAKYPYVCQDFDQSLFDCLQSGLARINKYKMFTLVFPKPSNNPSEIIDAFKRFCKKNQLEYSVIHNLEGRKIKKQEAYLVINDSDLVYILKLCKKDALEAGNDIGIISYNDTPLKEVVGDGITVISTDFKELGIKAAKHILEHKKTQIINPTSLILRGSL